MSNVNGEFRFSRVRMRASFKHEIRDVPGSEWDRDASVERSIKIGLLSFSYLISGAAAADGTVKASLSWPR